MCQIDDWIGVYRRRREWSEKPSPILTGQTSVKEGAWKLLVLCRSDMIAYRHASRHNKVTYAAKCVILDGLGTQDSTTGGAQSVLNPPVGDKRHSTTT